MSRYNSQTQQDPELAVDMVAVQWGFGHNFPTIYFARHGQRLRHLMLERANAPETQQEDHSCVAVHPTIVKVENKIAGLDDRFPSLQPHGVNYAGHKALKDLSTQQTLQQVGPKPSAPAAESLPSTKIVSIGDVPQSLESPLHKKSLRARMDDYDVGIDLKLRRA